MFRLSRRNTFYRVLCLPTQYSDDDSKPKVRERYRITVSRRSFDFSGSRRAARARARRISVDPLTP